MGSSLTRPLELDDVAGPPAPAESTTPEAAAAPAAPEQAPLFKGCWSCRLISGTGLLGAGAYVYLVARRPMKLGYAPGPGNILHMAVGISIAAWGIIILVDPKGKAYRVA